MALDDHIRILSGVRLFTGFTQDQLRLLAFGAEAMTLPAGKKLYREDDDADSAYIVVRGKIRLFRENEGEPVDVGMAEAGLDARRDGADRRRPAVDQRGSRNRHRGAQDQPLDVPPHPGGIP